MGWGNPMFVNVWTRTGLWERADKEWLVGQGRGGLRPYPVGSPFWLW